MLAIILSFVFVTTITCYVLLIFIQYIKYSRLISFICSLFIKTGT